MRSTMGREVRAGVVWLRAGLGLEGADWQSLQAHIIHPNRPSGRAVPMVKHQFMCNAGLSGSSSCCCHQRGRLGWPKAITNRTLSRKCSLTQPWVGEGFEVQVQWLQKTHMFVSSSNWFGRHLRGKKKNISSIQSAGEKNNNIWIRFRVQ